MSNKIILKTPEQIEKMRVAGRLAAEVLEMIEPYVAVGITTAELDKICHDYIVDVQKATPAPLNYKGFPKSICTSVNHVVCHGIPSDKKLKKGDILNIDVTVIKEGFHGDTSKMFFVGGKESASIMAQRLTEVTYECLLKAIEIVKPGNMLLDVANVIEKHAKSHNFSIVEAFCGHGIGQNFHEEPQVLHYVSKNPQEHKCLKTILKPGMTFTIEPMINAGKKQVTILRDGWTAVTKDKNLSAQWEHTLVVTELGCEVLTKRKDEVI
ncbi:type I methionyl aminopeptidase [Fastidiosibacter lacustris]|uniref:type I methionyl aminopeptidase n=1 Tax=Fastidiosibacter lacustris TaxID=2056695 RepID=UPI000E34C499|nr:type I methionyl aminopeptidase [Fastidiosibacter lacustris]